MDPGRGEEAGELRKEVLKKGKHPFVPNAKHTMKNPPAVLDLKLRRVWAGEVWVRGEDGHSMSWDVNFRDDLDMPGFGKGNNFPHIILKAKEP